MSNKYAAFGHYSAHNIMGTMQGTCVHGQEGLRTLNTHNEH